jgi:hypothetical protein
MSKRSLNLSVEPSSIERAQRYSRRHGVSISKLVDDFLSHLPMDEEALASLTPDVRALIGIGAGEAGRESYRRHLLEKYGR